MLPADNVYLKAMLPVNGDYRAEGWNVRVAAVRMLEPGELEIALVVPGEQAGDLQQALAELPGPAEVRSLIERRAGMFGHTLSPVYYTKHLWRDDAPSWRYHA